MKEKDGQQVKLTGGAKRSDGADDRAAHADGPDGDERRAELQRLARLAADVSLALTEGDTARDMLRRCTDAFVRHLDAAFARVWTLDEAENVLELQASSGMYTHTDGAHARVPVGKFKIGLIAEERRPHLTNSVVGDPRVGDQEWARREGMVSFAGYPLIVAGRLVGVVAMFARHPLTDTTLEAMAAVANAVALGIERKRSEELLRASEELNNAVLNALVAHIAVLDREGRIIAVNEAWRRFARENEGEAETTGVGVNYLDACGVTAGDGDREVRAGVRAVLEGRRESFEVEYACHTPDRARWFLMSVTPLRAGRGGAVVAHREITERKEAEEALARVGREREALLEEVSTPLVPVLEGVLVMPLIGTLDTARAQRATQAALSEVSRTGARACIIDITGARIVDTHAVANLSNLVQALRLVGAESIVTGVGAHAAQSIVSLGLDLQGMRTYRTLAQALSALVKSGAGKL